MIFQKSFDALLNDLLTDYQNQFPEADTSQGSLIFIKSACLASALWGVYRYQDYIAQQIFPDTADVANLEHHAWVRGLTRKVDETDAELLARLLEYIRRPPAGGNEADYEKWALEVDDVHAAYCIPLAQGPGTVDVVILSTAEDEMPAQALIDAVYAHIDQLRPVTASTFRVLAPTKLLEDVTMTVSGATAQEKTAITSDLSAYLATLVPGETLYRSQLVSIAIQGGADDVNLMVPVSNVVPTASEMIRPGTITVT